MNQDKKRRVISVTVTILVHFFLLVLLMFITLRLADKDKMEDGIPVLFGNIENAAGPNERGISKKGNVNENDKTQKVDKAEKTPAVTPVKTVREAEMPSMTQTIEKSVAAEEAKNKRKVELRKMATEENARKRAKEEANKKLEEEIANKKAEEAAAAKKAAEESARKAVVNSKVSGAFGKGGNIGSNGYTSGKGNQGSPKGNSNTGATTGVGGTGTAFANVGSRIPKDLRKPSYDDPTSEGTIIVAISVNSIGQVTSAIIKNATTTSATLRNAAIAAARQSSFSSGSENENGTITYKFKQK